MVRSWQVTWSVCFGSPSSGSCPLIMTTSAIGWYWERTARTRTTRSLQYLGFVLVRPQLLVVPGKDAPAGAYFCPLFRWNRCLPTGRRGTSEMGVGRALHDPWPGAHPRKDARHGGCCINFGMGFSLRGKASSRVPRFFCASLSLSLCLCCDAPRRSI